MLTSDFNPEDVAWCRECRTHVDKHCDGCGTPFLDNERAYRSQSFHYHPAGVNGVSGTRAVHRELCVDCYRIDHAEVYPGQCPDLPDRGVDPKFHAAQRVAGYRQRLDKILTDGGHISPEDTELLKRVVAVGLRFI